MSIDTAITFVRTATEAFMCSNFHVSPPLFFVECNAPVATLRSSINRILVVGSASKTNSRPHLKSSWAARAEHLGEARAGLTESDAGEVAAMAGKVRGIVQVERLADERQTPPFFKHELPAQPQIERLKIVAKPVTLRQRQPGDRCALAVNLVGVGLVELGDEALQFRTPQAAVESVHRGSGQQVACGAVAVEIAPADESAQRWCARIREVDPAIESRARKWHNAQEFTFTDSSLNYMRGSLRHVDMAK